MYGDKGHPYADYTRPIDKGKAVEKSDGKRSMVAAIEAPCVGPWQIGRIPMSNHKTWTMRLVTRRLRSAGFIPMSGLELTQKATGVGYSG